MNEQVDSLPHASRAVYITVVTPAGNTEPLAILLSKNTIPQSSEAKGGAHATVAVVPLSGFTAIFTGQSVINGSSSSSSKIT